MHASCRASRRSGGAAPVPEHLFLSEAEWEQVLRRGERLAAARAEERVPLFATARNPASAYRAFIGEQRAAGRRIVLAAAEERDLRVLARRAGGAADDRSRLVSGWNEVRAARAGRHADCCVPISMPASCDRGTRSR